MLDKQSSAPSTRRISPEVKISNKIILLTGAVLLAAMHVLNGCSYRASAVSGTTNNGSSFNLTNFNGKLNACSDNDNIRKGFERDCKKGTIKRYRSGGMECFTCEQKPRKPLVRPKAPDIGEAIPPDDEQKPPQKRPKTPAGIMQ